MEGRVAYQQLSNKNQESSNLQQNQLTYQLFKSKCQQTNRSVERGICGVDRGGRLGCLSLLTSLTS